MHQVAYDLRTSADTLGRTVTTGDEINTSIDMNSVEINLETPPGFKIDPLLEAEYMAALGKLSR